MTSSYVDAINIDKVSLLTRKKISDSLKGKTHSLETRIKMSESKLGKKNYYFGKKLHSSILFAAQKSKGKLIYVYSEKDKSLVNNLPFISIRDTAKYLPICTGTLIRKLDTGIPFKGYYYYSLSLKKRIKCYKWLKIILILLKSRWCFKIISKGNYYT